MYQLLEEIGIKLLKKTDPERANKIAILALERGLVRPFKKSGQYGAPFHLGDLKFPNRVGVAAGFDKNGRAAHALLGLGFGFTEVGTVTPLPQEGNEKPRIFRLRKDQAVINRLGFNNDGHEVVYYRLSPRRQSSGILGVNVGANKTSNDWVLDYQTGIKRFCDIADYLVMNISSPNTPGLRNLQAKEALDRLVASCIDTRNEMEHHVARKVPLLLKIAPDIDMNELDDIVDVVLKRGLDGLIVSNTTLSRDNLYDPQMSQAGGLSGKPLMERSTQLLQETRIRVGPDLPLIGVGGIMNGADALEKFRAGANLIQLYTGLTYSGFSLAKECLLAADRYFPDPDSPDAGLPEPDLSVQNRS